MDMPHKSNNDEQTHKHVRGLDELPEDERSHLQRLVDREPITAVVDSDLLFSGHYGHNRLLLGSNHLFRIKDGKVTRRVALGDVASAHCRDFLRYVASSSPSLSASPSLSLLSRFCLVLSNASPMHRN